MAKKNEKQIQFATDQYTNKIYDAVAKAHPDPLTDEEEKSMRALIGLTVSTVLVDLNNKKGLR